jgi:hypothetical protein
MTPGNDDIDKLVAELRDERNIHFSEVALCRRAADALERATRLIRPLCDRAPESPGCLWPKCDCGIPSPDGEAV